MAGTPHTDAAHGSQRRRRVIARAVLLAGLLALALLVAAATATPVAAAENSTHEIEADFGDDEVGDFGDDADTTITISGGGGDANTTPAIVSTRNDALSTETLFRILTAGEDPAEMGSVGENELDKRIGNGTLNKLSWTSGPGDELNVIAYGGDDESVVVWSDESTASGTVTFDVEEVDPPNTYDFDVTAFETGATATATIDVVETDLSGSFSADRYEAPAGELVEFSVSLDGADEGYVVLGGDRLSDPDIPTGYLDVLHVEDGDTITANTRLIGTNANSEAVYGEDVVSYAQTYGPNTDADETETFEGLRFEDADGDSVGDSLSDLRSAASTGGIAGPLTPQRYRLTLGTGDAITIRSDDIVAPERSFDRSHLVLTEPEFGEDLSIATAPGGPAGADAAEDDPLADAVDRSTITEGDRLVLQFEAVGFGGALAHLAEADSSYDDGREAVYEDGGVRADVFNDLLEIEEGLSLSIEQTNPGPNERRTRLDLSSVSSGDAYVFVDEPADGVPGDASAVGTYTLVIDTRGNAFDDALAAGNEFEVKLALEGDAGERYEFDRSGGTPPAPFAAKSASTSEFDQQFPYLWPEESGSVLNASFRIGEERLEYDHTTADGDLLVTPEEGVISGNTTLHPATELEGEQISDAGPTPSLSRDSTTPDSADGNFSLTGDFTDAEPGQRITFELYAEGDFYDARPVWVVSDLDEPFTFAVENVTEEVTVTEGESLSNLTATVRNAGDLRGEDRLTLDVDDERLVDSERVRLNPDRTENVSFAGTTADLPPGEYTYTLSTETDDTSGTLIVEPAEDPDDASELDDSDVADDAADDGDDAEVDGPDEADETDDAADDGDDVEDEADETDGVDGADDDDDGDGDDPAPTFLPFGTREVLGSTAVVGATYLLGHWV